MSSKSRERLVAVLVMLTTCGLSLVSAYSTGAATKVCNTRDMKPEHARVGFVTSGSNFTVEVLGSTEELQYTAGGPSCKLYMFVWLI